MSAPNRLARRSTLPLTLTAAVGIALTLIIAEMAVRVLLPMKAPATERAVFLQYDSLLGWSHKPGQRARFVQYDFQVDVSINRLGLRDSEYSARKGERHRLLVIGDSFAWGFGVEHDERFTEVLEERHPEWEVINAGVNGYGTDQELLYLKDRGMSLDPDVVLLLVHPNDFENNVASEQYWYFKPRFMIDGDEILLGNVPVPRATVEQRLRRLILGRTYLGQVLAGAWRRVKSAPGRRPVQNPGDSVLKGAALTERLLREIHRVCRAGSAEFVLVSVPMPEEARSILTRVATENGIPFLALDSTFENGVTTPPLTFPHDEHWTAHGHRLAAESIEKFLHETGILGSPDGGGSG